LASILLPERVPELREPAFAGNEQLRSFPSPGVGFSRIREREVVVPLVIGYSVEGRPLEVYRFGNGHRNLLIVAGIHGGYEWNTIELANELIDFLKTNQHLIPSDVQLHILPVLNPDGEARAHNFLGRGNANNVDLNRNWNVHWTSVLPQFGCWNIVRLTGGPYPVSEPETNSLMRYIRNTNFEAVISYHSAGLGIFAGGLSATRKSLHLAEAVAEVSNYPYPPIDIGCDYTGTFIDWAAWVGIAAIDIELSTHFYTDFEQNLRILDTFLHWTAPVE
jgi:predicted deacylase